jgi:hypothetical protein
MFFCCHVLLKYGVRSIAENCVEALAVMEADDRAGDSNLASA